MREAGQVQLCELLVLGHDGRSQKLLGVSQESLHSKGGSNDVWTGE
jgi:hypothetical protein